ncbi:MAG: hypothetical protein ACOC97_06125 [Myxococcota bacterium]
MTPDWMAEYFAGEKAESLLFIGAGLLAIAFSGVILAARSPWWPATIPLIAIAAIQLAVGGTVYLRTDDQVGALTEQLATDPRAFRADELARMREVNDAFVAYRWTEVALAVVGLGLVGLGHARRRQGVLAFGVGLALQAILMLAFDLAAEARAHDYTEAIRAHTPSPMAR